MLTAVLTSLVLFMAIARVVDGRHRTRKLAQWTALSAGGRASLAWLIEPLRDHRFTLDLCSNAMHERNVRNLRIGVRAVEAFAPNLAEGLDAVRDLARMVPAVLPLPPAPALLWRSWTLRGLAGLCAAGHLLLVTSGERLTLRAWMLGRSLRLCLPWLRGAVGVAGEPTWVRVRDVIADLRLVGDEAEVTFEALVSSLDALGAYAPVKTASQT